MVIGGGVGSGCGVCPGPSGAGGWAESPAIDANAMTAEAIERRVVIVSFEAGPTGLVCIWLTLARAVERMRATCGTAAARR